MSSKKGPFHNLKGSQERTINQWFYEGFQKKYFDYKIALLFNILANPDKHLNTLCSEEVSFGKISFQTSNMLDKKQFLDYIKTDILESYYHCLETFIRLFISHSSFSDCPIMNQVTLENKKYRRRIENIANANFNGLNSIYSIDDTISLVFYGCKKANKIKDVNIKNIKKWLQEICKVLLNNSEYNAFKHGGSLSIRKQNVSINKIFDKDVNIKIENDTVQFLESYEEDKQYKFALRVNHIKYDKCLMIMIFVSEAINQIMQIGKNRYVLHHKNITFAHELYIASMDYNYIISELKKNNDNYIMEYMRFNLRYNENDTT